MQYRRLRSANLGGDVVELTLMSTACKWFVCLYRTRGWPCLAPAQLRRPHSAAEAGNGRWKWTRRRGGPSLLQRHAVCKVSHRDVAVSFSSPKPSSLWLKLLFSLLLSPSVLDVCFAGRVSFMLTSPLIFRPKCEEACYQRRLSKIVTQRTYLHGSFRSCAVRKVAHLSLTSSKLSFSLSNESQPKSLFVSAWCRHYRPVSGIFKWIRDSIIDAFLTSGTNYSYGYLEVWGHADKIWMSAWNCF